MSGLDEIYSRLRPHRSESQQQASSESKASSIWETDPQPQQVTTTRPASVASSMSKPSGTSAQNTVERSMSNNLLSLLNIKPKASPATQSALPGFVASESASKPAGAFPDRLTAGTPESSAGQEPPANTQRFLLDLLVNKTAAQASQQSPSLPTPDLPVSAEKPAQLIPPSKQDASRTSTPSATARLASDATVIHSASTPLAGLFTYNNPFDQLHASSPLNKANAPPLVQPMPPMNAQPMSVPDKLETLGEQVDRQVKEALATAAPSWIMEKNEQGDSAWSTAEDEDIKARVEEDVEVTNFPQRPFVSLELQPSLVARSFRTPTWDNATPVARLKKDFSHDDRVLATASSNHIIYSVAPRESKPATGLKIIRQDDGKNKHIWADTKERLCSVQIASNDAEERESVLATGVNGTIFYAAIPTATASDEFDSTNLDMYGFVMPPPPNNDEPLTSTVATGSTTIKTRAKLSNLRSKEFFAVARGRQIHLISPAVVQNQYVDSQTRRVDTDQYLRDHSISINTGKAGKDFSLSEDDTILVSLDKVNKVKFWDLRPLLQKAEFESKQEAKDPIFSFSAGATGSKADDKTSPSSITFVDKDRAHSKKIALRYVLIGYQQNHILQLWDLGLGRCVQELRLPESDADVGEHSKGVCSITYHPKSAIITVGHPGRNSVFFIHLSAPKYNLATMDQATYISYLAQGNHKAVPTPENTAIMSGVREFSCAKAGQLRSLDVLKVPFVSAAQAGLPNPNESIFELYMMHSKGVLGIPITKADLGWDAKGKVLRPADGVKRGMVAVSDIKLPTALDDKTASQKEAEAVTAPPKQAATGQSKHVQSEATKASAKAAQTSKAPPQPAHKVVEVSRGVDRTSPSKNVGKAGTPPPGHSAGKPVSSTAKPPSEAVAPVKTQTSIKIEPATPTSAVSSSLKPASINGAGAEKNQVDVSSPTPVAVNENLITKQLPDLHKKLAQERPAANAEAIEKHFTEMYKKLDSERRVVDAQHAAQQEAVLRLVSSTLTENTENTLQRIVMKSIKDDVIPSLSSELTAHLNQTLRVNLLESAQKEIKSILPNALKTNLKDALADRSVTQRIATEVSSELAKQIDSQVKAAVQSNLEKVQQTVSAQNAANHNEIKALVVPKTKDKETISKLERLLVESEQRVTSLLSAMHGQQKLMAAEIASLRNQIMEKQPDAARQLEPSKEELSEVDRLTELLNNGNYEQATIEWLHSTEQAQLFDTLFIRINPSYLQHVSPLVALTVSAAVTASLEHNIAKRLEWLSFVVDHTNFADPDISDVAPKILDVLVQRLQGAYMQIAETESPNHEVLRKLAAQNRQISEMRKAFS